MKGDYMANLISKVDAGVVKLETYALVLVSAGAAALSGLDPSALPHKWAAGVLVVDNALIILKPKLAKAVTVTQNFTTGGGEQTVTSLVDRVTGDVKHVVTSGEAVVKQDVADVKAVTSSIHTVVKDEVQQVPSATQQADDEKAKTEAAAARAALQAQADNAKEILKAAEAALNANPPEPAGPGA